MTVRVGFVGAGSITNAMIGGLVQNSRGQNRDIWVYDIDFHKSSAVSRRYSIQCAEVLEQLVKSSDIVIMTLQTTVVERVTRILSQMLSADKVLVSTAVGYTLEQMTLHSNHLPCIRMMPTIAARVARSTTAYACSSGISEVQIEMFKALIQPLGTLVELDETLIDAYAAVYSTTPAFLSIFMESMMDAARAAGFEKNTENYALAAKVIKGTAEMFISSGVHPGQLKDEICTPASITIEGVLELEKDKMRSHLLEAYRKAFEKASKL